MIQSYETNPEAIRQLLAQHGLSSASKAGIRRFVHEKTGQWVNWRTLDKAIRLGGPSRKDTVELLAQALGVALDEFLATPSRSRGQNRPLRVAVLMSSAVSYLHDIEFGLRQGLERLTEPLGWELEYYTASQWSEPTQDLSPRRWEKVAKGLLDEARPSGFHYHVGLGTPASKALQHVLGSAYGDPIPLLFLGVTDPVFTGLVDSIHRSHSRNLRATDRAPQVAGVYYGDGIRQIAIYARMLFPDRALYFLYRQGVPYDKMAAARLREMQVTDKTNAPDKIYSCSHWPTLDDMFDPEGVYFSWYTFEYMFEFEEYRDVIESRIIFATARNNVRRYQGAVAGASAEDEEVGRTGASMIVDHMKGLADWRHHDIIAPQINYWINMNSADKHKVEFSDTILRGAGRVFGGPG